MKTISFRVKTDEEIQQAIAEDSRICSAMYRFAFNRYKDGLSKKDIYAKVNETFANVNCHLRSCAQGEAHMKFLQNGSDPDKKVHFGKFLRYQRGLISKEEYKDSRNIGVVSVGEANQKGNRLFQVDVENGKFVWKRSRKEHYDLVVAEKLSDKRKALLSKIQSLMEEKKLPISFRLKKDRVYVIYDEKVVEKEKRFKRLFSNRVLGIDLNPNYFGISILEFN